MLRNIFPLLAITFVDICGFSLIFPLLPFYAERFGASPLMIGAMVSVSALCGLLSSPFVGALSDRIGRRNMLLVTQAATALSYFMLARADNLGAILVARAIEGFSIGGLAVGQAYIADRTTLEQRSRAYAWLAIAHGTGSIMGPAICVWLLPLGDSLPFTVAAYIAASTVLLTYFLVNDSRAPQDAQGSIVDSIMRTLRHPELRRLLIVYLCFLNGFTMWISSLGLLVQRLAGFSATQASQLYAYSALIAVCVQLLLAGHLLTAFGLNARLIAGLVLVMIAYCAIPWFTTFAAVLSIVAFWAVGSALVRPTLNTLFSDNAAEAERGAVMGTAGAAFNLSFCVGPLISTQILTYHAAYTGVLPAALIGFALLVLAVMNRPNASDPVSTQAP